MNRKTSPILLPFLRHAARSALCFLGLPVDTSPIPLASLFAKQGVQVRYCPSYALVPQVRKVAHAAGSFMFGETVHRSDSPPDLKVLSKNTSPQSLVPSSAFMLGDETGFIGTALFLKVLLEVY